MYNVRLNVVFCNYEINMNSKELSSPELIHHAESTARALQKGQVILYPTDTVWSIGCDIENKAAVKRVHQIKKSKVESNLVILVESISMLKDYLVSLHPRIETLLVYHKKPLSIIYDNPDNLPEHLINKNGTVAIRITNESFSQSIIKNFGRPIVATSAALTGSKKNPATYAEIEQYIIDEVDYITPYYENPDMDGMPSVMARYNRKGDLEFLRS